jgi:hypothetical protein
MEDDDFAASLQAGSFRARLKSLHLSKPLKFSTRWHKRTRVLKIPARDAMPVHGENRVHHAFHSPGHWHVHLSSYGGVTCAEIVLLLITPLTFLNNLISLRLGHSIVPACGKRGTQRTRSAF